MQQRMHLTAYEEHTTATSRKLERLMHENAILHSGTLPPLDQDHELKVSYHCLSEAEHGWNYTHQQLDLTRTHMIIHLKHAIK
jgi:hypothetical protein